ncbi:MAG: CatB-related O-acetyltransferase [Acidobacteriota bacterium]
MNALARLLRFLADRLSSRPPRPFYTRDGLHGDVRANVGDHTYGLPTIIEFGEGAMLKIGKFCSIAPDVTVMLGGNHRVDWVSTYPFPALPERWPDGKNIKGHPCTKGDVVIGNDVWVGRGATILSGITIGDGAVIAARAVVTKHVPAYAVVAGNPARVVKLRFSEDQVRSLLALRWWDWPEKVVAEALPLLCDGNVDQLKAFASKKELSFAASATPLDHEGPLAQ